MSPIFLVVQLGSRIVQRVLVAGIILVNAFPVLVLAGIALFAMTTIFRSLLYL